MAGLMFQRLNFNESLIRYSFCYPYKNGGYEKLTPSAESFSLSISQFQFNPLWTSRKKINIYTTWGYWRHADDILWLFPYLWTLFLLDSANPCAQIPDIHLMSLMLQRPGNCRAWPSAKCRWSASSQGHKASKEESSLWRKNMASQHQKKKNTKNNLQKPCSFGLQCLQMFTVYSLKFAAVSSGFNLNVIWFICGTWSTQTEAVAAIP